MADVFQGDDSKAAADGLGKGEFDRSGSGNGGFDLIHAVDLLEFALGLGGFARFGAKTISKLLEGGDLFLLVFVGGEVLFFAGGFFDHIFVVVPTVAVKFRLRNFDDGVDQFIQKLAIVGDHQNGAGISAEIFLKPDERFEVEVVGRLVEKKEVRFLDEKSGEVGSHDPASAQGFGFAVEIGIAEGKAAEDLFGSGFELPSTEFGEGVEGLVIFGVFESAGGFVAFDGLLDAGHFWGGGAGKFENGLVACRGRFLGQKAHGDIFFKGDATIVWAGVAEDQGKEGGFAGSVGADEADPIFAVDLEGDIAEKGAPCE